MRILLLSIILAGCSSHPVTDLRASGDQAQFYQRDVRECKDLAKEVAWSWSFHYDRVVERCLKGRGHSILSAWADG